MWRGDLETNSRFLEPRTLQRPDAATMPHGLPPTAMRFSVFPEATSTTDTSPDGPLAVYTLLPSGLTAMPHGRVPTSSIERTNARVATSMIAIDLARPSDTKICRPSGESASPIGRGAIGVPSVLGI